MEAKQQKCPICESTMLTHKSKLGPKFMIKARVYRYSAGEYDLAGFAVGSVTKDNLISQDTIKVGDKLVGFLSSGIHSNGFSLVRYVRRKAVCVLDG